MSALMRRHFDDVAERYDDLRSPAQLGTPHDERLVELGDLRGRCVLDVGCGTGRLLAALARDYGVRGAGVDPSAEMIEVARSRVPSAIELAVGRAEALPFADSSFERAVATFAVHLLDRPRAFAEIRRVLSPGGRLMISTSDPAAFPRVWMAPLFSSYVDVEQRRFPSAEALRAELEAAGFVRPATERFAIERRFTRETALAKLRGRAASTFVLLGEDEYRAGLELAERELPDPVEYTLELLLVTADVPGSS